MTNFCIVALDPGGTTGWAKFQATKMIEPNGDVRYFDRQWTCGELNTNRHHQELYNMLGMFHTDIYHIVTESFEYRNLERPGLELVSREYIGVAELYCQQRGMLLQQQGANLGKITPKSFVKKHNLVRLALWTPGWGHAMDAYGHLLYYMINRTHTLKQELLERGWK